LISPTVIVTAGHCTYEIDGGRVHFEADIESGRPGNGYPFGGGTSIEFEEVHTFPMYEDDTHFLYDLYVVVLKQPVERDVYGTLPEPGFLDGLSQRRGLSNQLFAVVVYGLQGIKPTAISELVRYNGELRLINVRGTHGIPAGTSVTFSANPGPPASGGTCFGDSGAAIF
jgi:hypothetical protein